MKIIGLTGVFGSGKSTVSRILKGQGFKIIDADSIGHRLLMNSRPVRKKILEVFGTTQRKCLSEIVFNDKKRLKQLNKIMHPEMKKIIKRELRLTKSTNKIVIEAAVLLEMKLVELVDEIWLITASRSTILNRMSKFMTTSEIQKRLSNASSIKKMTKIADKIIKNDSELTDLLKMVKSLI